MGHNQKYYRQTHQTTQKLQEREADRARFFFELAFTAAQNALKGEFPNQIGLDAAAVIARMMPPPATKDG